MKVEGTLELIGNGTWRSGFTKVSVVEIGDHSLRSVWVPDYLKTYMSTGNAMTLLVIRLLWQRALCGVRTSNGRTYTAMGMRLFMLFLICGVGAGVLLLMLWMALLTQRGLRTSGEVQFILAVAVVLLLAMWQGIGNLLAYIRFRSGA